MASAVEIAWAAGFYEGEGSIGFSGRNLAMSASQQESEPLERFAKIVGVGKIFGPYRADQLLTWKVTGPSAVVAFNLLRPWLSARRCRQGDTAIEAWNERPKRRFTHGKLHARGRCGCDLCTEALRRYHRDRARGKRVAA